MNLQIHSNEDYEKSWKRYLDHTHKRFLDELHTSPDDSILDPSCGTGLLAKRMIENGMPYSNFVLNDIAEEMLRKARNRLREQPHISFTQQPVQQLDFDAASFTKILSLNAFHTYSKQVEVLQLFWEILKEDGQLFLLDWNNSGLFRPVNWMIKQWVPEIIDTKSLSEIENLLVDSGFQIQETKEWYYRYWKFYFVKAVKN